MQRKGPAYFLDASRVRVRSLTQAQGNQNLRAVHGSTHGARHDQQVKRELYRIVQSAGQQRK